MASENGDVTSDKIALALGRMVIEAAHVEFFLRDFIVDVISENPQLGHLAVKRLTIRNLADILPDVVRASGEGHLVKQAQTLASEVRRWMEKRNLVHDALAGPPNEDWALRTAQTSYHVTGQVSVRELDELTKRLRRLVEEIAELSGAWWAAPVKPKKRQNSNPN